MYLFRSAIIREEIIFCLGEIFFQTQNKKNKNKIYFYGYTRSSRFFISFRRLPVIVESDSLASNLDNMIKYFDFISLQL